MLTLKKSNKQTKKAFNHMYTHHRDCLNLHLQAAQEFENTEKTFCVIFISVVPEL